MKGPHPHPLKGKKEKEVKDSREMMTKSKINLKFFEFFRKEFTVSD